MSLAEHLSASINGKGASKRDELQSPFNLCRAECIPLQEECHYRNDRLAAVGAILGQVAFTDEHDQASMGCCKDPRASKSAEN